MLGTVDLSKKLERDEYKQRLLDCQLRLRKLALELYQEKRSLIVGLPATTTS